MKSIEQDKIDGWIKELNHGSLDEKEKANLLVGLKTGLQKETEALDLLSNKINILEEELLKRLTFKTGDHAVAMMDDGEIIGQISELHTITLPTGVIIIALSPHFYPEYLCDIDKLRKPSPEEIQKFEADRSNIEEDIRRKELRDKDQ